MENFTIEGGARLKGSVKIDGAKNAVLPILAATLLAETGVCVMEETPAFNDVSVISELLQSLGAEVESSENGQICVNASGLNSCYAPYETVRKMRASFLVMGPLLARLGQAKIPLPGGCAIGSRPIDLHLKGFEALGAKIVTGHGFVEAQAEQLHGAQIYLDFPSVGATENIMMAACLAEGNTIIENAAEEPEITDLANFLNKMGANVTGAGTDIIRIEGKPGLTGTVYQVIPDRIEAGTFMIAAAATGGDVLIKNVVSDHLKPLIAKLRETGAEIIEGDNWLRVLGRVPLRATDIKTLPYPGFPTDLQAQMTALLTIAEGTSVVTETVFENRFMHLDELSRMGADVKIEGRTAIIHGVPLLSGTQVKATDLRAGAALIIAGLVAKGETEISCIHHIDRGYVNIEEKFRGLGAKIRRTGQADEAQIAECAIC